MLRNNYVMSPKSKWLVFTTTIVDKGLNRTELICSLSVKFRNILWCALPDRLSGVSGLYTEVFEIFFFRGGGLIEDFFVLGLFKLGCGRNIRLHSKHSVSCLN